MKVDTSMSIYSESLTAADEFDRTELLHLRYIMRRLQFLEAQVRERGLSRGARSGGAVHAEMEVAALEWLLTDVGFLDVQAQRPTTSVEH